MTRLSSPVKSMKEHYTAVVIGSGYGGGISASRLARAGQSVCLLERGKERWPGEFPDTETEAAENMQLNTPDGHIGSRLGLYEFHVNEDMNALVGCGLGGTSLINANVALRAVPRVWENPKWPKPVVDDIPTRLEAGYQRAEEMLKPNPLPDDYPDIPKLKALKQSAESMNWGDQFYRPPINVTFKTPESGVNHVGVEQKACNNCGDCVSGCNYHAKNTTLMNYIPDAWNHGAEIFTQCSVRYIERKDNKWVVHFQWLGQGREKFDAPTLFVTADIVIVSAGTIGSTEIMLRSKAMGLDLSDRVGDNFSCNGDVLGFGYNGEETINGIGWGHHEPGEIPPVGPCITGIIDHRNTPNVNEGFVIEEGSIPGALAGILPATFGLASKAFGKDTDHGFVDWIKEKTRAAASLLMGAYRGAIHNTQTYLVMSHDDADGHVKLKDDRVRIDWKGVGTEPIFETVNHALYESVKPQGATYVENPIWSKLFHRSLITVHPLGGCIMADNAEGGAVNHKGQAFSGSGGNAVHEGLYVSDGAVVPTSLGVNPLLTISALAERCVSIMAEERGWTIDYSLPSKPREVPPPLKMGVKFTEVMRGYFSTTVKDDFERAAEAGKQDDSRMEFALTIASDDLNDILENPEHPASIAGTVSAPALSPEPCRVLEGEFQLFVVNPNQVDTHNMVYRMKLASEEGKTYFFHGEKIIDDSSILEMWPQTTTLYTTVYDGDDQNAPVFGKGILHIEPVDFMKQMTTMEITNAPNVEARLEGMARFGKYFAGVLYESYGGVFAKETYFNPDAPPRKKRPLKAGAPVIHNFMTSDNVMLRLTRYQGGGKGPVLLVHGGGVSSRIFSTDLPDTNLLEYLYQHGYDVWLFDFRVSILLEASEQRSNGDQIANIDMPEAVALVRKLTGADTIQAVVHCYGSNCFFMSMLAGLQGVRSIVCSQVATSLITKPLTAIKSGLHVPGVLDAMGFDTLTAYVTENSNWKAKLLDEALKFYPIQKDEECRSPVCHRITFLYALLYEHQQLNELIHNNLHELFGVGNIGMFEHLALMVRKKEVVSHNGEDIYVTEENLKKLAIPICFIHGAENQCYLPVSTENTLNQLSQANGASLYSRHVIPNYGHIDCIFGKNAALDVYPFILDHLEKTQ